MSILAWPGVLFIVAWLILWLAVKVSFAAIHVLVAVGLLMLMVGSVSGTARRT
jgi:hypothetical protein